MSSEIAGTKGLADRYALALYELAKERGVLDQVAGDLRQFQSMLDESADLRRLIASPVVTRKEHRKGIVALAEKVGLSELSRHFLGLLSTNRRLPALSGIIAAYLARLSAARGEVTAEVVSARKLSDSQSQALSAALRQAVGKDVAVRSTIDPSILGGLIVRIGSRMVDNSVRTKLQRLQLAMKGVG
ncbi:F0F1 ATP synthase subunit delta [Haematospirillum jordaniae]|uniref:ATP synthase subunit delta n=1 Tax=Haematospirillum jordaniae TaxID=1549855 RepID=A0A143DD11_9PROT|nr:F0F1 ATP synthase subunit delta [Haematospirillum jordaniae]AMW34612.1 ATP synthase subunit delta [Haematospirillum jordaniae]NKD44867.1 F0F1 ATP synthase subunit delta [Haematospirillum jordaniae]NKD57058.1 F0F1 ATP synthase subunit delta [Haematospirillum jordaniae]NKD58786.1 F0F1 ATP synthase subunit delta [Haematospirillum jordaniae]NKD66983.1 F0F1 ATP synthase subunit delta [Haematospirillum jordaniae]